MLASKLGACWKCMALSSSLLALSLATLLLAIERLPDLAVLLAAMSSGFFAAFTGAHVLVLAARRALRARDGRLPQERARSCCG